MFSKFFQSRGNFPQILFFIEETVQPRYSKHFAVDYSQRKVNIFFNWDKNKKPIKLKYFGKTK